MVELVETSFVDLDRLDRRVSLVELVETSFVDLGRLDRRVSLISAGSIVGTPEVWEGLATEHPLNVRIT
ncbi:hypothetical protein [Nocardioides sp. Bht2]|uniref:hypothetical protein n=1 Tax=Nocardioides sp. Bht2 TaxID=3392297 RepID=UPI0039B59ED5